MRVMTWNLWWRFADFQRRHGSIVATLRAVRPDVVGLQEIWDGPDDDQVSMLAEALGMHAAVSMSPAPGRWQQRTGEQDRGVGNAVLSRWPIVRQQCRTLPGGDGQTVLYTAVDAPGGEVPFFTTHLASAPSGSALRCEQVRAVAEMVAAHAGTGHPPVLTGDFNAEPQSDEMRLLGGHLTAPAVPGLVLLDAWRFADGPGWTWSRRNGHLADTGLPDARIDYIHVGLRGMSATGRPLRTWVAGDQPVDGVWPSDHFAVVADLAA